METFVLSELRSKVMYEISNVDEKKNQMNNETYQGISLYLLFIPHKGEPIQNVTICRVEVYSNVTYMNHTFSL